MISFGRAVRSLFYSSVPGLGELTSQFAGFFKALGHVTEDGCSANELSPLVVQQGNSEFDRNAPAILGQSRHGQEVALA